MSILYNIPFLTQTKIIPIKQVKSLFYWINKQFNVVDHDRKKTLGPDRTCAEWILRNGGSVKWSNNPKSVSDYNQLPPEKMGFQLHEVDASNTNIMMVGFEHFKGCKHIQKVIFHNCYYVDDDAVGALCFLKNSLKCLQITNCPSVTDAGILNLKTLTTLQELILGELKSIKNIDNTVQVLKDHLPKCNIYCKN